MDKNLLSRLYRHGVQLMAVGIVTGLLAGIVVTYFNIAAELLSKYSKDLYALVRENPAFVPLLFVVLAIIAFGIATLAKFVPMVRGSGIPQAEGATRGLLELKWYKSLPAMAASCLACIISGLTAGAEGPSMFIGATCGEGTSKLLRCTDMENAIKSRAERARDLPLRSTHRLRASRLHLKRHTDDLHLRFSYAHFPRCFPQ